MTAPCIVGHILCRNENDRRTAFRADQPRLAAVPFNLKTSIWTAHPPARRRKCQRVASHCTASNLTRLASPHGIMPMKRSDKRMCDFMQDRVTDVRLFGMPHIMARQRNSAIRIVTLTGTTACMIKPYMPPFKTMLCHQQSRHVQRILQRPWRSGC